jgi:hypothetical protein
VLLLDGVLNVDLLALPQVDIPCFLYETSVGMRLGSRGEMLEMYGTLVYETLEYHLVHLVRWNSSRSVPSNL